MSLFLSKSYFRSEVGKLWNANPPQESASILDIQHFTEGYWNSLEIEGYEGVVTPVVNYIYFRDLLARIDSASVSADTIEDGAALMEELFRTIPVNTSFESSEQSVIPRSISVTFNSLAAGGKLRDALIPLFRSGVEGSPATADIISLISDFFTYWEVQINDGGTTVTARIY